MKTLLIILVAVMALSAEVRKDTVSVLKCDTLTVIKCDSIKIVYTTTITQDTLKDEKEPLKVKPKEKAKKEKKKKK